MQRLRFRRDSRMPLEGNKSHGTLVPSKLKFYKTDANAFRLIGGFTIATTQIPFVFYVASVF
jgi:hypothetical protein